MPSDDERKPSSRLETLRWPIILTIGVVVSLGIVSSGFYFYVLDRERYYNDRYFRLLNSQSAALNRRIDNYRDVLYSIGLSRPGFSINTVIVKDSVFGVMLAQELLERGNKTRCLKSGLWGLSKLLATQLCQVPDFFNGEVVIQPLLSEIQRDGERKRVRRTGATGTKPGLLAEMQRTGERKLKGRENKKGNGIGTISSGPLLPCTPIAPTQGRSVGKEAFGIEPTWRGTMAVFRVEALFPDLMPLGSSNQQCVPIQLKVTAELNARGILDRTLMDRSFEDVLLIDKRGHVVVQESEGGIQFTQATLLFKGDKEGAMSGSESRGSSTAVDSSSGKKGNEVDFKILVDRKDNENLLKKVPVRLEATVAGKQMDVFAVPLILPIIERDQEGSLEDSSFEGKRNYILVGLVSKDKLRNEIWQLSPSVLLVLLLVVLSIILALPLLKLLLMGPQDQWSLRDFAFLVSAGLIGTGLLTLAFADAGAFWWSKEQVDDELTTFQDSMLDHAHKEIGDAVRQLEIFDARRVGESNKPEDEQKCDKTRASSFAITTTLDILSWHEWTPHDLWYKTFDTVFWVNCAGHLREQWDVQGIDKAFLPFVINLSDRGYFTAIASGRSWKLGEVNTLFFVEPIVSRTDGSNTAIVAIRSKVRNSQGPGEIVVAGLESRFLSLFEPLIPPGMGFVVIDTSNGMALFHSHVQRNLRENFFEEVDHNKKLKGLIATRARGCESGTYGGNSHRFCVREFQDIPWTLIVFKNMEPLRVANLQAVTVSSFLFAIYAVVVLAVVGGGLAVAKMPRPTIPDWLWPSGERHITYIVGSSVNLALVLMGALSLLLLSPQSAFVVDVIILPVFGMLTTCILLKYGLFKSPASIGSHRISYRVLLGSLLALCSMHPAAVCMALSYEAEQILIWKADAFDLAKSFARSADLIRERYQHHTNSTLLTERLYAERFDAHLGLDKHSRGWAQWNVCLDEGKDDDPTGKYLLKDKKDGFEELYQFLRVPYNEEFTRTHGLFSATQQSEDVRWYNRPSDRLRIVSYRPVHDLKRLDKKGYLESHERWNAVGTMYPWLRWPGVILIGAPLIIAFAIYLLRRPSAQFIFLVLIGGLAAVVFIVKYPGNTSLVIWSMLGSLFFSWLVYILPGVAACRVLLLDVEYEENRNLNELREALYEKEKSEALETKQIPTFSERVREAFVQEFGVSKRLCEIGEKILADNGKKKDFVRACQSTGFEPHPVWLFALDEARHYYGSVWEEMDKEEKMTLFHLARNGFIVGNHPSLFRLISKGWVTCFPQLRFVNESFRLFVLSKKDQMIELQRELASGVWDRLVWPLTFVMIFILAGLMYTQQELLTSATAFVGVLAGLVPVVSKIFDLFKTQKAGSPA